MEADYYCETHKTHHSDFDCVECVKEEKDTQIQKLEAENKKLKQKDRQLRGLFVEMIRCSQGFSRESFIKLEKRFVALTQPPKEDN